MRRAAAFLCLAMATAMQPQTVPLHKLLSTCIDAAGRGCARIRSVQESGATDATLKIAGDAKSALTAADLAAQAAVVGALAKAWPGLTIVGEEDEAALDEDFELDKPLDDALWTGSAPRAWISRRRAFSSTRSTGRGSSSRGASTPCSASSASPWATRPCVVRLDCRFPRAAGRRA